MNWSIIHNINSLLIRFHFFESMAYFKMHIKSLNFFAFPVFSINNSKKLSINKNGWNHWSSSFIKYIHNWMCFPFKSQLYSVFRFLLKWTLINVNNKIVFVNHFQNSWWKYILLNNYFPDTPLIVVDPPFL